MLALLMILSAVVVVTPSGASAETFVVKKQVSSNGEDWYDLVYAKYGDIVQFKITITYNGEESGADNIVATDTMPSCLEYVKTLESENTTPTINGNTLVWNLGETYLKQYCSTDIIFEAKVVGIDKNINTVNVTAEEECCPDNEIYGVDTATVMVNSSVDVQKNVWDPEAKAWVDDLGWVIKNQNVRFQITSTYHGKTPMRCMNVTDCLPKCCLEYANNVYIEIAGKEISKNDVSYPDITVDNGTWFFDHIWFDWRSADLYLQNGESVIIEFDAKVIKYCERTVTNHASTFLWGCYVCDPHNYVFGSDTATIECYPHDPIFEKKVWNAGVWNEKTSAYVADIVKFKIELTYYGISNLTDIKIVDTLPCVLKYADNAALVITRNNTVGISEIKGNVSEDKKTVWWNLTKELGDRDTLSIEFDALVTGATGECDCSAINTASYTANNSEKEYKGSDTAKINSTHKPPAQPINLSICIMRISVNYVRAVIKNSGTEDISNIGFAIWVNRTRSGTNIAKVDSTIEALKKGDAQYISTPYKSIVRKFGRVTITVKLTVGSETFTKTAKGFILGRIIITRPLLRFCR